MKKTVIYLIAIMIFSILTCSFAAEAQKNFRIEAAYTTFRYDAGQVLWELDYTFQQDRFVYMKQEDGSFRWETDLHLKIWKDDALLMEKSWKYQHNVSDTTKKDDDVQFIDKYKLLLDPGLYSITFVAQDSYHTERIDSLRFSDVRISTFPEDKLTLSDIQLAFRIQRNAQDVNSPFYKNTLNVLPNPGHLYDEKNSFLYFYVEIYNTLKSIQDSSYFLVYQVLDRDGKSVEEVKPVRRERPRRSDSAVEWGALKVASCRTGTYSLHLAIEDAKEKEYASKDMRFYVYNKERIGGEETVVVDLEKLFMTSPFMDMPGPMLDDDFNKAFYISKKEEINIFNSIKDIDKKRRWLFQFWQSKDLNPNTPANEFRDTYFRRIDYANANFSAFNLQGWKSDRGRVYILYGEPDYINRYHNEPNMKPHEIWHFDQIQGGVEFVFADFNETREFRLVHSSLRGELQNYDWEDLVKKGQY